MIGKTEGIVLRTLDYGEGNKILTVFTKEMGKIGMMAQGARKTKSRFSAVSQPFIQALFLFHSGSSLAKLNHAEMIHSFHKVRADLFSTAYASYMVELTDRLTEDKQKSALLYNLLLESLLQIENGKDADVIARIFEIQILSMFGFKPVLNRCTSCQHGAPPWFFSIREGGLLCEMCRRKDPYALLLADGVARILHQFQIMDVKQLGRIQLKENTRKQLEKVMFLFIDEYVGIRLKSRQFLEQLANIENILPRKEKHHGETAGESASGGGLDTGHPSG